MKKKIGWILYVFLGGLLPHGKYGCFKISNFIRNVCCSLLFDSRGHNTNIGRRIRLSSQITLGDNSSIGDQSYISGKVIIGNNVMIAPRCAFIALDHVFDSSNSLINIGSENKSIIIEDNCWICFGATILSGCTIGKGSIVGAGAVVTKNIPPYSVVGGVPARILKTRK